MASNPKSREPRRQPAASNPWLIAVTVTLATFMEVLDTSIANVALPHIAGSLAASVDESTWVLTSYLVANAVMLPISGWLSNVIGRKRFYMVCVAVFTVSSLLCAPGAQPADADRLPRPAGRWAAAACSPASRRSWPTPSPPSKRGMAFALYGVAVVVAPAIGPTLGGWITDNYSWHWIFLINVPIGILSLALTHRVVQDPVVPEETPPLKPPRGLYRHQSHRYRRWLPAVCTRQRPGERLVRLEDHSDQRDGCHRRAGCSGASAS